MGNICVCIKKSNTPEILSAPTNKTLYYQEDNLEFNRTTEFYKDNKENNSEDKNFIIKSKAANQTSGNINENNKLNHINGNHHEKNLNDNYEAPVLKENYMDYAMDFFDEINKYRGNPKLFMDLIRKYPNIAFHNDYNKKAGFEIGWNQKLYDQVDEFLENNNDKKLNVEFQNKISEIIKKNSLSCFEVNCAELNFEKNVLEILKKYYSKHQEIFQNDYTIGAIGIVKNDDLYRIVLVFA